VKVAPPGGRMVRSHGGPGTDSPTRWTCTNCKGTQVITEAFDLRYFQLSGPGWLADQRFDISATLPAGTGKAQFRLMKKALLEERFGLKAHLETRESQVYDLVVARGGVKLSPSTTPEPALASGRPPTFEKNGVPEIPAGVSMVHSDGTSTKKQAARETIAQLAGFLAGQLSKTVNDRRGLTGKYDYVLTYSEDRQGSAAPAEEPKAEFFPALQNQLGLRLESKKGPGDFVVLYRMDRLPTGN